jgi:hypothetical protein
LYGERTGVEGVWVGGSEVMHGKKRGCWSRSVKHFTVMSSQKLLAMFDG